MPVPYKNRIDFIENVIKDARGCDVYLPITIRTEHVKLPVAVQVKDVIYFLVDKGMTDSAAYAYLRDIYVNKKTMSVQPSEISLFEKNSIDEKLYGSISKMSIEKIMKEYFVHAAFKESLDMKSINTVMYALMSKYYEFQNADMIGLPMLMNIKLCSGKKK